MKKLNEKKYFVRFVVLFVMAVFVISGYGVPVLAISKKDLKAIISKTPYYDPEDEKCDVGGPAGNGPLDGPFFPKISDTADLEKRMTDYILKTKPSSPLLAHVGEFVSYGKDSNINPVMVLVMSQQETGLGTTGNGVPGKFNILNVQHGGSVRFAPYPSYTTAISEYMKLMASKTYMGPPSSFTTVSQVIHRTTPVGDGANNPDNFTTFVISSIHKILDGIATDGTVDATVVPAKTCGKVNSAGAYGWDLEGPNAMVSYEQGDKRWGDKPYGQNLESIAATGCGPSSLAMIGATLLNDSSITPLTLANQYGDRFHTPGAGTAWGIIPAFANDYKLKMLDIGTNFQAAADTLKAGGLVLISVDPGWFTGGGHFMVVRSVTADSSGFFMNDPAGAGLHKDSETRAFTADFITNQGGVKKMWSFSK